MIKKICYSIIGLVLLCSLCHIIRERKINNLILRLVHGNELKQYKLLNDTVSSSNYEIVPLQASCTDGEYEFKKIKFDRQNNQYIAIAVPYKNVEVSEEPLSCVYKINLNGFVTDTLSASVNCYFDNGFIELSDSTRSNWINTGDRTNITKLKRENRECLLSKEQFDKRFRELYDACESTGIDINGYKYQWIYSFYFPNEVIQLFGEADADIYSYESNYFNENNIEEKINTRFADIESGVVGNISADYFHFNNRFGMTIDFSTAPKSYPDPTFSGVCYFTLLHNKEPLKFIADALFEKDKVDCQKIVSIGYPPYDILKNSDVLFIKHHTLLYVLRKKS